MRQAQQKADRQTGTQATVETGADSALTFSFGAVLKDWRAHRRMTQLDLSLTSGVSQRHISFLETGRARPSRGTVLHLAEILDIPLRERNVLLQAAGFATVFEEAALSTPAMEAFEEALHALLEHHEPFPALVLDGRWNLVRMNAGGLRFFGRYADPLEALVAIGAPTEFQLIRLCLHDAGLKPFLVNWEPLVASFLQRARRALVFNPRDELLPVLLEEIIGHPDAPTAWRTPTWEAQPEPAIKLVLEKDGKRASLITVQAHFGSPQHVALEELSVELFFPGDEQTRLLLTEP